MTITEKLAVMADSLPQQTRSIYPPPFAQQMQGRIKRKLGDYFALRNFGVNLTSLPPGTVSALRHCHSKQDELIYVLEGSPVLISDQGREQLAPGMCVGFAAGCGNAAQIANESSELVRILEIGDRSAGDEVVYPDDDLLAEEHQGQWIFKHKNGQAY